MKTIVRDIAFGSRKCLPSGRNVPHRRHNSKSLLRYFWKCCRSHSFFCFCKMYTIVFLSLRSASKVTSSRSRPF